LAYGIFVPEVSTGERLVDDGHMAGGFDIASQKQPAAQQISIQSLEIAFATQVKCGTPAPGMRFSWHNDFGPSE
jgi:hypothetical protein